jgi:3-oxoacyl-[acyl-carrier protein] reductase
LILLVFAHDVVATQDNRVMITAATGALGEAISNGLAAEGYELIIAGRNQTKLDDLQKRLQAKYKRDIQTVIIDFSDTVTIEEAAKKLEQQAIKGLVLIGPRPSLSKNNIPSKEEWSKVFAETFIAPLEVIRLFSPQIQNNGSVVVIAGNSSKNYLPNYPNTNVMRLAWIGEVKNLVQFFAERKVRVNVISPGPILTSHHRDKIKEKSIANKISFEEQLARDVSSIPLKSYGATEDVVNIISFLLSRKSGHLNGTNTVLDGGESTAY